MTCAKCPKLILNMLKDVRGSWRVGTNMIPSEKHGETTGKKTWQSFITMLPSICLFHNFINISFLRGFWFSLAAKHPSTPIPIPVCPQGLTTKQPPCGSAMHLKLSLIAWSFFLAFPAAQIDMSQRVTKKVGAAHPPIPSKVF